MKAPATYLETVLNSGLSRNWTALFKLRKETMASRGPSLAPLNTPVASERSDAVSARRFISLTEVSTTLRDLEQNLFSRAPDIVEDQLLELSGHTDVHTSWWRRLRVINSSRAVLEKLASDNSNWATLVACIEQIITQPQTAREQARIAFLNRIEPVLSLTGVRRQERYELVQIFGSREKISTFVTRLLIDAPALYELEKPFLQNFNPDVSGSMLSVRGSSGLANSKYCPVDETPPAPREMWRIAVVVGALVWAFWRIF